ncbi:hypothetical protein D3C76_915750 [compost metagenome]
MLEHCRYLIQHVHPLQGLAQGVRVLQFGAYHLAVEPVQGCASLRVTDPGAHLLLPGEQCPDQGVAQMPIGTGDQR